MYAFKRKKKGLYFKMKVHFIFIVIMEEIGQDKNIDDYSSYDYKKAARNFLHYGGLNESEINEIVKRLSY